MGKGREKRRGRNIMVVSGWGSERRTAGRHYVCGGAVHEKEYFHSSTGLEWDMCPGISKTRLVTSRPRGRSLGSQDTKGSQFVIFLSSTAVTTPLKCD